MTQPPTHTPAPRDINDRDAARSDVLQELATLETTRTIRTLKRVVRQLRYFEREAANSKWPVNGKLIVIIRNGRALTCQMEIGWQEDESPATG